MAARRQVLNIGRFPDLFQDVSIGLLGHIAIFVFVRNSWQVLLR